MSIGEMALDRRPRRSSASKQKPIMSRQAIRDYQQRDGDYYNYRNSYYQDDRARDATRQRL